MLMSSPYPQFPDKYINLQRLITVSKATSQIQILDVNSSSPHPEALL